MDDPVTPDPGRLEALYTRCLDLAAWCVDRRMWCLLVAVPALTLILVGIGRWVLQDFPNSGDEYCYLYQAATLARGRLWNPTPPVPEFFVFNYIVNDSGRTYGSFPPGWPIFLALTTRLHVPLWLVNPLLGTATLVFIFLLGRELYNARIGMIAAWLTGMSGFFLFNAASYFSHTFCGLLVLMAAYFAACRKGNDHVLVVLAGFLVGWAVVTRYFTGTVCALPIVWLLVHERPHPVRTLALFVIGGLPWIATILAYNTALSGDPWHLTTTPTTFANWFAPGFLKRGGDIMSNHLLRFILWTPPLLLPIYVVYLRRAPAHLRRGPLDWMLVLLAGLLFFYVNRGGNQYGPRFYYEVFPFVVIFATASLFRGDTWQELNRVDRRLFAMMMWSVAITPLSLIVHGAIERQVTSERTDPYRLVAQANLTNAVVLFNDRIGTLRSMAAEDLTRNGISYTGPVLYGLDQGETANCRARFQLDNRALYRYTWDRSARRGALSAVRCDEAALNP